MSNMDYNVINNGGNATLTAHAEYSMAGVINEHHFCKLPDFLVLLWNI